MIPSDYVLAAENAYRRDQVRTSIRNHAARRGLLRRELLRRRQRRANAVATTARSLRTA